MKKVNILLGTGILSFLLLSFVAKDKCEKPNERKETRAAYMELQKPFVEALQSEINPAQLSLDEISYLETGEDIELGFDTSEYLPLGFNAYEGMELNLDDIVFVESEETFDLGFNTADYLPKGFNAYEGMGIDLSVASYEVNLDDIPYIVVDEEFDLGFDTQKYLPKGFDAYAK